MENLDDYETHFTVMNYKDEVKLKQVSYAPEYCYIIKVLKLDILQKLWRVDQNRFFKSFLGISGALR